MEEWKDIVGYEGLYQVSSLGKVKRISDSWMVTLYCKEPRKGFVPYKFVRLKNLSKISKDFFVHTLVAAAFIGPRPIGLVVMHADDNPANNSVANLSYGTHSQNQKDAYARGRRVVDIARIKIMGKNNGRNKPVYLYKDNALVYQFFGVRDAEKERKIDHRKIKQLCSTGEPDSDGVVWSYQNN